MIVIPVSRAFLRPLPFVIFTTNFLPDRWISHIEETEEKTTQMGEVGNATPCSLHGREEFNETEDDHHVFGRDGEEEIDVRWDDWERASRRREVFHRWLRRLR